MILIYAHLMLSFYILGRWEERFDKLGWKDHIIIWLWLPVIVAFLSSLLAKKVLGD
ncbi:hypothetical protein [Serratia fonticola]|uniref:hypothetical protein n=1 Tax=Serratia fonticola TaxID=47917 RepID=UPI00209742BC|nr:hypothetical protein [Serratia fonticola]MCO7511831.1 hypothetical protein [Serratia fonticola]HBE9080240.1 hypothetical protein [Serratia fonticola]